jgi:hypothetical protein
MSVMQLVTTSEIQHLKEESKMRKQATTHKTVNDNQGVAIFRTIPLKEIAPPISNTLLKS